MYRIKLTQRYIPALSLITIFVVLSHFVSENIIKSNSEYAKIINISGKQRMLSQKLVILGNTFLLDNNSKKNLTSALNEIETAHNYLKQKIFNKKLKKIFFEDNLDANLKKYLDNYHKLLKTKNKQHIINAMNYSNDILKQLDNAVKAYESHANEQLNKLRSYEFYLMISALIVLLLEAIFIFRPAAKQIEQSQKLLKSHYEDYETALLETSNSAIIAIDYTGKITTYNKKAQEIFGWSKDEMLGHRNLLKLIPDQYKQLHTKSSLQYLTTGQSSGVINNTHEWEGLRKDGTVFPLRISIGAKWKGAKTIAIATITDISKEKESEAILFEQSKMAAMGEMIGNIAHQWRQPLSVISTGVTGLKMQKEYNNLTDKEFFKTCDMINNNAQYLSKTIDDFRNFIKGDRVQVKFNLTDDINSFLHIVEGSIKSNHINLIQDIQDGIIIFGYPNELIQCFINIFNNSKDAFKDISEDRYLFITVYLKGDKTVIIFKDNAGGIPQEVLPRIFEPYFTTKHKSQGTGLGLHMTYNLIVDGMCGTIEANNIKYTYNGNNYSGVEFIITLPLKH